MTKLTPVLTVIVVVIISIVSISVYNNVSTSGHVSTPVLPGTVLTSVTYGPPSNYSQTLPDFVLQGGCPLLRPQGSAIIICVVVNIPPTTLAYSSPILLSANTSGTQLTVSPTPINLVNGAVTSPVFVSVTFTNLSNTSPGNYIITLNGTGQQSCTTTSGAPPPPCTHTLQIYAVIKWVI